MGPRGFRRRGRRRGLIVGAAVGASVARHSQRRADQEMMAAQANEPSYNETSDLDELERLGRLKDEGILTQQEFDAKKKQILGL